MKKQKISVKNRNYKRQPYENYRTEKYNSQYKKKKASKGKLNRRVEITVARICGPEGRSVEFMKY